MERPLLPWWAVGVVLAVLELAVFATQDRGIGASTTYPYLAGVAWPGLRNASWTKIAPAGAWELWFLVGAFAGAWGMAWARKSIPGAALRAEPPSAARLAAAFLGGVLLIFGARLADGCTSGHVLSGGIQLAASSLWFTLWALLALGATMAVLRRAGKLPPRGGG
ncbi:MAG: YeeE/YedE thiosulfate transporter family protein [Rhodospirillales bacterium]|nr:YeeE/YedE thiosulfate transporter family protein [Rhodospirillales bacterium]